MTTTTPKADEFYVAGKRRLPPYVPSETNGHIQIIEQSHRRLQARYAVQHIHSDGTFTTIARHPDLYGAQVAAWRAARERSAPVTLTPQPDHSDRSERAGGR